MGFFSFFFFSAVGAAGVASTGVSSCEVVPRFSSTRAALPIHRLDSERPLKMLPLAQLQHQANTDNTLTSLLVSACFLAQAKRRYGSNWTTGMCEKMGCCLSVLHHGAKWQSCRGEEVSPALAGGLGLDAAGLGLHNTPTHISKKHPRISSEHPSMSAQRTLNSVNGAPASYGPVASAAPPWQSALK